MPKYLDLIESRLNDDPESFASSFGVPKMIPWIATQFKNGYNSPRDFEKISMWVVGKNPRLDDFDFNSALKNAKKYIEDKKNTNFDPHIDFDTSNVVIEFDDGNKWVSVGSQDLNALINRLQHDCHNELRGVYDGDGECSALIDAQGNVLCVLYKDANDCGVIGTGGVYPNYPKEIKSLCVKRGIDLLPEAFDNSGLINAIKTGQINIDGLKDKRSLMKRLGAEDIIDCGLLSHAHHCPIKTVYDLYCKTGKSCLLIYAMSYLISHGLTKTGAYNTIKALANKNEEVKSAMGNIDSADDRAYIKMMDDAVLDIINL